LPDDSAKKEEKYMNILVINPNTSVGVTEKIKTVALDAASEQT